MGTGVTPRGARGSTSRGVFRVCAVAAVNAAMMNRSSNDRTRVITRFCVPPRCVWTSFNDRVTCQRGRGVQMTNGNRQRIGGIGRLGDTVELKQARYHVLHL